MIQDIVRDMESSNIDEPDPSVGIISHFTLNGKVLDVTSFSLYSVVEPGMLTMQHKVRDIQINSLFVNQTQT